MKLINIVYGDDYDDADILRVPDFVSDNIEEIVQNFFDWASNTRDHGYYKQSAAGHEVLCVGTEEFIKWLNDNYSQYENQEIVIVESHTKYNADYPLAEF